MRGSSVRSHHKAERLANGLYQGGFARTIQSIKDIDSGQELKGVFFKTPEVGYIKTL
jgi:hypothetical protein